MVASAAERSLAGVLRKEGRYEEAEALLLHALEVQERALGTTHRELCATLEGLAELLREIGRRAEVLARSRRALEIATSAQTDDAPRLRRLVDELSIERA